MKRYKGYDIHPHDTNSSGMKYYTYGKDGKLRADTLQGIKQLIDEELTTMTYNLIKDISSFKDSHTSNRYKVKAFKTSQAMHEFQNKQHDNSWKILEGHNLKSGTYFSQFDRNGIRYINVKELL